MIQKEKKTLLLIFENLLGLAPKTTHDDLVELYYNGINFIKNNYHNKSRELKSAAMYYLNLEYDNVGLKELSIENSINDFFTIYNNEFENYKKKFELITDENYLLLSFVYSKFTSSSSYLP